VQSIAELQYVSPSIYHTRREFDCYCTVDLTSPGMSQSIVVYGGYLYVILLGQFTSLVCRFTTLPFSPRRLTIYQCLLT
jgi:hypothetical protein